MASRARQRSSRRASAADSPPEPPLYRPFAHLGFDATILAGSPIGVKLLLWLYLGAPAPGPEWLLLHAHLQIVGFFGTLILGVAPHLLARFTGRPLMPPPSWFAPTVAAALVLRITGTWRELPAAVVVAALCQAAVFVAFGAQVWRVFAAEPLVLVRMHLTVATGWLALACLIKAALRWRALSAGLSLPDLGAMRVVHAMAIFGGVVGWMLGVLLRAGSMLVPDWRLPLGVARVVSWLLAAGVGLVAAGGWRPR